MSKKILSFIVMLVPITLWAQQEHQEKKEVLIIGTMHSVPGIVKNSYKPLLKRAVAYQPQAIYVEYLMPDDYLSWSYIKDNGSKKSREFYRLSDSLKTALIFDRLEFDRLSKKKVTSLSSSELNQLITLFAHQRDYANYSYYSYIKQYGVGGSKKSLGNENTDLSFKLALQLGINSLHGIDDQQVTKQYLQTWSDCAKFGESNGDTDILKKLDKKDTRANWSPGLMGRLGIYTNSYKSLNRKHLINSARYAENKNSACNNCTEYWDERNSRIAKNLLQHLNQAGYQKAVVIIGAGHVIGLKQELKKQSPDVKVVLLYEQ